MSMVRPKLNGPFLCGIMDSHCSSRGIETLNGRFPTMWKFGGSGRYGRGEYTLEVHPVHLVYSYLIVNASISASTWQPPIVVIFFFIMHVGR